MFDTLFKQHYPCHMTSNTTNSSTSEEFPTISMEPPSESSSSTEESHPRSAWLLEPTTLPRIPSPLWQTGESSRNLVLMPSEPPSPPRNETHSVKPSTNLKSNAKPHEILESQASEPRVLRVRKEDIAALCQVISEFQSQFINY